MPNTPYREALGKAIATIEGLPAEYERLGYSGVHARMPREIAALRDLAALVERAVVNEAEYIPAANSRDSVRIQRVVREGREILFELADGYTPPEGT